MKRSMVLVLSMGAMLLVAGAASGAIITTYTDEAAFKAAIAPGYYQEGFNYAPWLTVEDPAIPSPQSFAGSGWAFQLSSSRGLSGQPTPAPDSGGATAPYYGVDALIVTFTGTLPKAVGGIFWVTNQYGAFVPGGTVALTLNSGGTYTYSDTSNYPAFTGFVSDTPITSMSLIDSGNWASMDNLVVGAPEPATLALMALGGVGLLLCRKR